MKNSIKKTKICLCTIISLLVISLFSSFVIPTRAQAISHTLSPRWASQSPFLKQKVLKTLGETVKKYPERAKNAVTILTCYLDFTNKDLEQVRLNTAILNMLAEMPPEYKTLEVVLKAVDFMKYKGEQDILLHQAGLKFFRSIPKELMYRKGRNGNNGNYANLSKAEKIYLREIRKYPLLTRIGEIKLGVLKLMGETEKERHKAREELITSNLRLPFSVVDKFFWWTSMAKSRLVPEGNIGLIRAVDKYDPCLGTKFSTHAIWWIRQIIRRNIINTNSDIRLPVHVYEEVCNFIKKCQYAKKDPKSKAFSDEEIAMAIGMKEEKVQDLREIMEYDCFSLDSPVRYKNMDSDKPKAEIVGAESKDFKNMENKIMTENWKELLKKLFFRTVVKIVDNKTKTQQIRFIAILRRRIKPKMEQTGEEETLEKIGEDHGVSRERIRQLETIAIKYVRGAAINQAEKTIVNNLLNDAYAQSNNSFAEFFKRIYIMCKFDKFCAMRLPCIKENCSVGVRNCLLTRLFQFYILERIEHGWYRINPIFKGRTPAETEENMAGLFDTKFEARKWKEKNRIVLNRNSCSKDRAFSVKECVKMDLAHRLLERMTAGAGMNRTPCVIRVWKGYASFAQADLPQCIRNAMENGPYELKFLELNELISDTQKKEPSENEITIFPFERLSDSQKEIIETGKINFINMDFEKQILDPYAFVQLEAIIASGIAYLNNDDFTFNNLYKMLTDSTDDIKVSIEKLKENPILAIKYIFMLNPGTVQINDLAPLNKRMKKLVDSAA